MAEPPLVKLTGRIDASNSQAAQAQLLAALSEDDQSLTVDLEDVPSIDSSGLGVFVLVFKQLQKQGGTVSLINVAPNVLAVFEQTHLDRLFLIEGRNALERAQAEEQAAAEAVAKAVAAPPARKSAPLAAPVASGPSRLNLMYGGLGLSVLLLVVTQVLFYQHITEDDLLPYLKSNATLVQAMLVDLHRTAHRYPAAGAELQQLLQRKGIELKNVYTKEPLQIVSGRPAAPGDVVYEPSNDSYTLRVVARDGKMLQEPAGGEFALTPRHVKLIAGLTAGGK